MKTHIMAAAIASLVSSMAIGSELPTKQELVRLKSVAPDVASWTKPADGMFEATSASGVRTKVYIGAAGKALHLSNLRDRLFDAQRLALSADADVSAAAVSNVAALEEQIDALTRTSNAKYSQTDDLLLGTCAGNYSTPSTFVANYDSFVDSPVASASSEYQLNFGPYPEQMSVFRSVAAEVDGQVAYASTSSITQTLDVSQSWLVFSGSCSMSTEHSVEAVCAGYGDYQAVRRMTTCANVINNAPLQADYQYTPISPRPRSGNY